MTESAIIAQGLSKSFGKVIALQDFSVTVNKGEIFGLVGPGGSGKSTALRLMAGLLRPDAGTALVAGCRAREEARQLKQKISYMSQRFGLYPDLSIGENMNFYAQLYGVDKKKRPAIINELLRLSGLLPFSDRQAGRLSGGMKQKLALSCALVHSPQVLFLDEPTNGVDPTSRRDFWQILYHLLENGATIFLTTSYLDEAERCTKIGLLHSGSLIAQGTPQKIKAHFPGQLFSLQVKNPRAALFPLRQRLPAKSVNLFGSHIHIAFAADFSSPQKAIGEAASELGLEDIACEPISPSLEDIFLALLEQPGREEL